MRETKWKEFKITDIFDIKNTKSILKEQILLDSGKIPYVTASEGNNAVMAYIDCPKEWIEKGNCVFIGGKTMVVTYQEADFCSNDSHNLALYLKDCIQPNRQIFLFMVSVVRKALSQKYSWGDSISYKKIQNDTIYVPVTTNGKPDWDYMSGRVRELEEERICELEAYLKTIGLNDFKLTENETNALNSFASKQWKAFRVGDLFEPLKVGYIGKGQKIGSATREPDKEHCIPLTCAKIGDNGILYWGKKGDFITYTNTLSVIADGAVSAGLVYAQPEEAGAYSHSYFIRIKDPEVSKYTNQFLSTVLTKVIYPKYSREDAPRWNKIEQEKIKLPISLSGTPDWDYMEQYIRAIEKTVIADVVKWKDKQIELTKEVVNREVS